jgi:hypothetical protein
MNNVRLGVDVGGTFTDLVALSEGELVTAKVPSTPQDQSVGVMNAIRASEVGADALSALAHGMTVATNALLERRGARTALVTTEGFRDVLEIARQNRPSLYDLTQDRPPTLVPRELRFAVNYLAPFLLTNLLLDRLEGSAPSRVITVSSEAQRWGKMDFEDLHGGLRSVCEKIGVDYDPGELPEFKKGIRDKQVTLSEIYTPKAIEIVSELFAYELDRFGYTAPGEPSGDNAAPR